MDSDEEEEGEEICICRDVAFSLFIPIKRIRSATSAPEFVCVLLSDGEKKFFIFDRLNFKLYEI